MINQTHFVIDLETLGKGPNAPIVAIGAVCIMHGLLAGEFYARVSLESSMALGRQVDASTIIWWLQQERPARAEIFDDGTMAPFTLPAALGALSEWMAYPWNDAGNARVWGNGSSFDNVILRESYQACGLDLPWQFRFDRDLRTILELYPDAKDVGPLQGTKHHALHDASHEAKQLCKALRLHAGKADSRTVLHGLLAQAADMLVNHDASIFERLPLADAIKGELENNPLIHQVEREEVSHV